MTPEEFICWLDGFRQWHDAAPDQAAWDRVQDALDSACRHLHASRKKLINVPGGEAP